MLVTPEMKIKDVLKINEHMIEAFVWLAPDFERLRNPQMRRMLGERANVEQAARMACAPLAEALYVLNLVAGVDEKQIENELNLLPVESFTYHPENPHRRPRELQGLKDDDNRVRFVDVLPRVERCEDTRPPIMRGLMDMAYDDDVLLVHHAFDPIPLRDLFAMRGFASWAEERSPHDWYIYFYRPGPRPSATAH